MVVFLVATGDGRYELEPGPVDAPAAPAVDGFWGRRLERVRARWTAAVEEARRSRADGRVARWRAALVCHVDESIEEQRSLWALRDRATATLVHPPSLSEGDASRELRAILAHARRYHGRWLGGDLVLFLVSGLLALVPGPNLVAYYFAFRVIGHYLSWRGARQALDAVSWTFEPRS